MVLSFAYTQNLNDSPSDIIPYPEVTINNTELRKITSEFTQEIYEIDVFLPEGYSEDSIEYPLIVILDAEYNFGCVVYITRRLIKNGDIPKVILAGIAYESDDEEEYYHIRMRDCTPPSTIHGHQTGGVEDFIQFLQSELFPFMDSNYRVLSDDRTIVGHSIGGFFGCYVLFNHTQLFNKYIIVSPSLWFSNNIAFQYEEMYAESGDDLNAKVFLSTGRRESDRMVQGTQRLINILEGRNYPGLEFHYLIPEDEHHRSIFPLAYTRGLQILFKSGL
jgi:predicted alpha/beta superfamily hydrolase